MNSLAFKPSHNLRRLKRRYAALRRRKSGVAFVEFALIAPIMITMYLGMVELSLGFGHSRKGTILARTLSDLVTQSPKVSNTELAAIFDATTAIVSPYPVVEITLRITSFRIDSVGKVFVDWSDVKNYSRSAVQFSPYGRCADGSTVVPKALQVAGTSIVVSEAKIKHTPLLSSGAGFVTPFDVSETFQMRPRVSTTVEREGVPTTPCPGETP